MSWESALGQLDDDSGVVEFGIHQINTKTGTPRWRRHSGGSSFRFETLRSALFSDKGARVACLGKSSYARNRYAADARSSVPFVATWLRGAELAFLARPGAVDPEVTLVPVTDIAAVRSAADAELLSQLAELFGRGAAAHGVRHLVSGAVRIP
jgi:hypothetical protein